MSNSTSKDMNNNSTQNQMPEIYLDLANKAIKNLNLVKAKFVVILPDGTTFDNGGDAIKVLTPKKKQGLKRPQAERKMPHGAYSKAFKADIASMQVGDVKCISATPEMLAAGVNIHDLQGSVSTIAHGLWGNDAHKTHKNMKTNCVELMRTA